MKKLGKVKMFPQKMLKKRNRLKTLEKKKNLKS